jgi:hypothetical protein
MQRLSIAILLSAFLFFNFGNANAGDSLESLKSKQISLEQELEIIKQQISELESQKADQATSLPKPTYFVTEFGIDEVNSAGGVEPYFVFFNPNQSSPIKYIKLRITPYNAVGDVISSSIGGQTTAGLSYTGPLSHSDGETRVNWGPIWYNTTAECIKLESIQISFVNGKSISFIGKTLYKALAPEINNVCRLKK